MSRSIENARDFCRWLEHLKTGDNYEKVIQAFNQPGCFRTMWANVAEGKILFRCKIHYGAEEAMSLDHSSKIGYLRQENYIKEYGRCNKPEQALSYLSENRDTAIIETLQSRKSGETCVITLGVWKMNKTLDTSYIVQPYKDKRVHAYEHQLGDRYDKYVEEKQKIYPDYKEFSGVYFDYLDGRLKSDERGLSYQITAAYTNMCLDVNTDDGSKSYGLIYPSVTQTDFFNVVFSKEVEDQKLISLIDAFRLKVKVIKDNPKVLADLEILEMTKCQSVDGDGNIKW